MATTSRPFPARFAGQCAGCPDPITPGELMVFVDAEGKWGLHHHCLPRPDAPRDDPRCGHCLHPVVVSYGDWIPPRYRQREVRTRCSPDCPGN